MAGGLCVDKTQMAKGTPDADDGGVVFYGADESEGNRGADVHHE